MRAQDAEFQSNGTRKQPAKVPKLYYLVVGLVILFGYSNLLSGFRIIPVVNVATDAPESSRLVGLVSRPDQLCSSTIGLFPNRSIVEKAVEDAEKFHEGGGSLKSIQLYLDRQIQTTYKALGVSYVPSDLVDPKRQEELTAPELIHEELRLGDTKKRGGYDQRSLPGKLLPKHPANIGGRLVDVMEPNSYDRWEAAIGSVGPVCTNEDRIQLRAKEHYEDKFMCSYQDLVQKRSSLEPAMESDCDIISIGSNDQWGFEQTVASQTNCRTHTFDCTISTPKHKPDLESVHFYSACISDRDQTIDGRSYVSYNTMWKMTGMKGPPTLLKMDVEGFEYDVLVSLVTEMSKAVGAGGEPVDILPQQIGVEIHYASRMFDLPWMLRMRQAGELALLFGTMYRKGGYLPVRVNFDPGCASCLEVLFVRILC
jgi:hypothetical protein